MFAVGNYSYGPSLATCARGRGRGGWFAGEFAAAS